MKVRQHRNTCLTNLILKVSDITRGASAVDVEVYGLRFQRGSGHAYGREA